MQGSKSPLIVVAVAGLGMTLVGCTVNNYPASPNQQQQSPRQQQAQQAAPVVQSAARPAPTPAPATRSAAAPAPVPKAAQPAAQPVQQQPSAAGRTYTIKPGDNLWNIAKEVYGDGTKYQRIIDANPGINPDNMKPGTKIVIP
jgi:5'-nucleotidase / UDP-sugar diphosphatase